MLDRPSLPPAGWLLDPADPTLLQWWDGTGWSGFRRPREEPAANPADRLPDRPHEPAASGPQPRPEPRPEPRHQPRPRPDGPTAAPTPDGSTSRTPTPPAPAAPAAPFGPEQGAYAPPVFTQQWDAAVMASLERLDPATRGARTQLFLEIRTPVLTAAAPDEEVLGSYAVAVHAPEERVDRPGQFLATGQLVVTDRRLLVVAQRVPEPTPVFVSDDLATVLLVTGLRGDAVRLDFHDDTVVVLRSLVPAAHSDLVAVLQVVTAD